MSPFPKLKSKIIIYLTLFGLGVCFTLFHYMTFPNYNEVRALAPSSDRILLDRNGQILNELRMDFQKRRMSWRELTGFSSTLQKVVIQAEDKRFYHHIGVDPLALVRALNATFNGQGVQGASTISMQVSDLISESVMSGKRKILKRSYLGKVRQIFRGLLLDLKWSKQEILEAYLNLIPLKSEYIGTTAFSRAYFHKDPLSLNFNESLIVASLIKAPNAPHLKVVKRVCQLGKTLKSEFNCNKLKNQIFSVLGRSPAFLKSNQLAKQLGQFLFTKFPNKSFIKSSIDKNLQQSVKRILLQNLSQLRNKNVNDAAAIVLDNNSGQVLAYVGSIEKFSKAPHVDGVRAKRLAGSTLKPFFYGEALDQKIITGSSVLLDDSTVIPWEGGVYRPFNYNNKFNGEVSVKQALASSLNVPAVKVVKMLGLQSTYSVLKRIGIQKLRSPDYYGTSMALGAVEVSLLELANAYRSIANGGKRSKVNFEVNDISNHKSIRILSKQSSFIISDILSDPNARSIGFGWNSPLETAHWSAVKTGTSKGLRDNWCVGYSQQYTVAVWAGNFDGSRMIDVSGITGAGPSWHEIMNLLHLKVESRRPDQPHGIVKRKVRHEWQGQSHFEYFIDGTEPKFENIKSGKHHAFQFTFPTINSRIILDPKLALNDQALFVRFKGTLPEGSRLLLNEKELGKAVSPFKIEDLSRGKNEIRVVSVKGKVLGKVKFVVQ